MTLARISRRRLLQGSAATALAATLPGHQALAADTVIGFVYVGPRDDYGYNQAHAEGAAALKKMPASRSSRRRRCRRPSTSQKTME